MNGAKEEFCSGIIPLRDDQGYWEALIAKHAKGMYWGFPKGHVEENEDPIAAASRELREETGYALEKILPYPPLKEDYTFFRGDQKIHKTVHYYLALVAKEDLAMSAEILDIQWVRAEDLSSYFSFSEGKILVKKLNKILRNH